MTDTLNLKNKLDKDLTSVSKKLEKKYGRKSRLDETKFLDKSSTVTKVLKALSSILIAIVALLCFVFCMGSFMSLIDKTPRLLFGYSTLQVISGSMAADSIQIKDQTYESGFQIGDKIAVRLVDTKTLKVGDKIAFYAYPENYIKYHSLNKKEIDSPNVETKYNYSFSQFWGFHTKEIRDASSHNAMLVFHHITNIYEDENNHLWYKTQGSANATKDTWFISEEMVVGIYDNSSMGKSILGFIDFLSSKIGFLLFMLIPILVIVAVLIQSVGKQLYLSILELDVVEQKRKLTDDVCVKHEVGYFMDTPTKYKVLSQASKKEVPTYVSLLWKDGEEPYALNKYVKKKRLVLYPIKKLLSLNQICEARYNDGEDIKKIASYYSQEKQLIKHKKQLIKNRIKLAHKLVKEKKRNTK